MVRPTPSEAARLLSSADELSTQVDAYAARESRAFLAWGLFALVALPPFDFVDGNIWGPVMLVASVAGWVATTRYYRERAGRVRLIAEGRSGVVWIVWMVWYAGLLVMAELLQPRLGFIWTAAAVAAAVPLLIVGAHLARAGR
jgi:hypothetical protein